MAPLVSVNLVPFPLLSASIAAIGVEKSPPGKAANHLYLTAEVAPCQEI